MEAVDQNVEQVSNSDYFDLEAEEFSSEEETHKPSQNKKKRKFHVAPQNNFFSPENIH